ncbi:hypothetical protein CANCADRAFT_138274 [Tortispora caseinolytica NRRL Y-17796]|uniref:Fe2OG dioxygenase domain-containing protein n=1 Tax=Tortispora caseinolytica NRRL Y-17796 TaxID=767744 RepID=A0A1E4TC55_9ASCO|nr:hypothetical protein CANCADRAFT_138274 [Tortispora caseinolytica NRRL Y-17796]
MGDVITERKIAQLKKVYPDADYNTLFEILLAYNGDTDAFLGKRDERDDTQPNHNKNHPLFRKMKASVTKNKSEQPAKSSRSRHKTTIMLDCPEVSRTIPYCSLHENILESSIADELLVYLLKQSPDWSKHAYNIAGREVYSHHTGCLYLDETEGEDHGALHEISEDGGRIKCVERSMPTILQTALNCINEKVRELLDDSSAKSFKANAALVNYYKDETDSVGYHSDQLTHIGPQAIIASLSLGASREFHIRPLEKPDHSMHNALNKNCTYITMLPHNSLFIMHPNFQETYKHSIPECESVHEIHDQAGRQRINITFRMYKENFRPSELPKCTTCGKHLILRTAFKKSGDYFWSCGRHDNGTFLWDTDLHSKRN